METNELKIVLDVIAARIKKHEDEIESFELNDTSFINSKRTKELGGLMRELAALRSDITNKFIELTKNDIDQLTVKP